MFQARLASSDDGRDRFSGSTRSGLAVAVRVGTQESAREGTRYRELKGKEITWPLPAYKHRNEKKGPVKGPFSLITVVMDYGFTLIPVTMLFLNHSGSVTIRFTLLDNRAVAIPITIMSFANAHASAYGTNSNSNIVRQSRRRNC